MQSALITGASSGIGRHLASLLSKNGYKIYLLGRDQVRLEEVQNSLEGPSAVLKVDLLNPNWLKEVQSLKSDKDFTEKLSLLVNNAGEFQRKSLSELVASDFRRQSQLQVEVPALLSQFCYPYLKKHGVQSSIINVSSTLGLRSMANTAHYSAAKAGMVNLTESLAIEMAPIRVNCVCPGIVNTPIHNFDEATKKQMDSLQLLNRVGEVEDIAQSINFLAGPLSLWTTGIVLKVDGGINLRQ